MSQRFAAICPELATYSSAAICRYYVLVHYRKIGKPATRIDGVTRMAGEDGALVMWDNSVVKRLDMVRLRESQQGQATSTKSSTPTVTPAQVTSKRHKTTASTPSIDTS